jgi:glycosyltransferase involved in cell wall biosynthesis
MTRVVHVNTRFLASGAERSVADIVAGYAGRDIEHVMLVGPEHDPRWIRKLLGDIQVIVVPDLIRQPHPVRDLLAARSLVRVFRRLRPDVVHTIQSKSGILGRAAARRVGVQTVIHTVNMGNFGQGFNAALSVAYRQAERTCARWTNQFIANGTDVRGRYVRAGVATADRFELVRSSVDVEVFRAASASGRDTARATLGLTGAGPIILFAGRLDARKGTHELPAFLMTLRERVPDAHLVIAGDGPLQSQIAREFATRGLEAAVTFLGFTSRLPEAMVAADCLVMLSRAEGLATVLVHAAAVGLPFVSNDVDGPHEMIVRGARGAISPIGDLPRAASLVVDQLSQGRGGPIDLSEWDPAHVRRRYGTVFASAVAKSAAL